MSRFFFISNLTNAEFNQMETNKEADILMCLLHKQVFSFIINQKALPLQCFIHAVPSILRRNGREGSTTF